MRFKGRARLIRFTLSGEAAGDIALGGDHLMIESQTHSIRFPTLLQMIIKCGGGR